MNDRLNNEMFGSGRNYVKPLVIAAIVILLSLVVMVGIAKAETVYSKGMTRATVGDCYADRTENDNYPIPDPYCIAKSDSGNNQEVKREENSQDTTVTITSTPIPYVPPVVIPTDNPTDTPPSNPPTESPDKTKCNAGRGNGSEGNPDCDPGNSGEHNNGGD